MLACARVTPVFSGPVAWACAGAGDCGTGPEGEEGGSEGSRAGQAGCTRARAPLSKMFRPPVRPQQGQGRMSPSIPRGLLQMSCCFPSCRYLVLHNLRSTGPAASPRFVQPAMGPPASPHPATVPPTGPAIAAMEPIVDDSCPELKLDMGTASSSDESAVAATTLSLAGLPISAAAADPFLVTLAGRTHLDPHTWSVRHRWFLTVFAGILVLNCSKFTRPCVSMTRMKTARPEAGSVAKRSDRARRRGCGRAVALRLTGSLAV